MKAFVENLGSYFCALLTLLGIQLLKNEALGVISRLSAFIVDRATKFLPVTERKRYREEWLADVEYAGEGGKKISELVTAIQIYRNARATAEETVVDNKRTRIDELNKRIDQVLPVLIILPLAIETLAVFQSVPSAESSTLLANLLYWGPTIFSFVLALRFYRLVQMETRLIVAHKKEVLLIRAQAR